MDEKAIENEIQAKGLNAPRLTPALIDAAIAAEYTGRASDMFAPAPMLPSMECLTVCVIVLRTGFTVVGKSACAGPENYDADLGHKIAREDARRQIWALEGYRLRTALAEKA